MRDHPRNPPDELADALRRTRLEFRPAQAVLLFRSDGAGFGEDGFPRQSSKRLQRQSQTRLTRSVREQQEPGALHAGSGLIPNEPDCPVGKQLIARMPKDSATGTLLGIAGHGAKTQQPALKRVFDKFDPPAEAQFVHDVPAVKPDSSCAGFEPTGDLDVRVTQREQKT